ncbi:hypothetical protein J2Q11_13190 [Tenacibaculum finnmarkense genomovar finnmarkense]|uniref:phage baseplate protein n=1 Tax=Tenacibaculum finnmarkense TaxID=2781243 RepID=UPI001EFB5B74|nr:hypothetical protein [Tenacibaculum finnmarkense]MCG8186970.1 hypothetical protein [Tenacibaculum finnmarkense genomovar finnmarkense]MCG8211001.1 hypothetical protein [Tenacibaculum finnmarkense genomovar finnmarkense]MCG8213770.1 hypothetical protein [Tenacibaculum finnmarkense genomovar finnmarkense]MCG8226614.1 hypothetical protein [Tenacibaculum finnmarkense genomovar finnmarkense]MCG8232083.1 hypothetical protein [Tenacibaculum finnmarkense genomovar finnmarkense]
MNYLDFQQNGGFPLETNTLTEMQKAWQIFNAFGFLAGDKTIISGCETSGNQITNGFIYLDGELLEFRGGIKQNSVVIIQEETKATFEDKTEKPVYFTRYATFGVSVNSIPWSDFKHIDNLIVLSNQVKKLKIELGKKATILDLGSEVKKLEKELAEIKPIFKEIKYVGTSVTQAELQRGWFIANGQNGTDNILGRMLVGYDANQTEFNTIGKKGGEKTHKLTVSELPSHRIRYKDIFYSEYTGTVNIPSKIGSGHTDRDNKGHEMYYRYSDSIGNDKPHNNLPPYIVALPIQFIG